MSLGSKGLSSFLLAAVVATTAMTVGCGEHHHRVYDPYYTDYHAWNHDEIIFYRQWCSETHRNSGRDFRKLRPEEQQEYWTWRHNHRDRDHR